MGRPEDPATGGADMTGLFEAIRRLWAGRFQAVALVFLGLVATTAVLADCLASDLPIVTRYHGTFYVLPNMFRPGALRRLDNQTIARTMAKSDWALYPLIRYGPNETMPGGSLSPYAHPGRPHLLGTDDVGRDVAAQLIHGSRTALVVGGLSVLIYSLIALLLGAAAGYLGGVVDRAVAWAVAVLLTFPTLLLILAFQAVTGSGSLWTLVAIIGLSGWAGPARLVRAEVMAVKARPHVLAARAAGAGHLRLLAVHILPEAVTPLLVSATFGVAWAILAESAVSFLGLGGGYASWGRLLAAGRTDLSAWWLVSFAGIALVLTVLSVGALADGIQDLAGAGRSSYRRAPDAAFHL